VALAIVRRPHEADEVAEDAFSTAFEKLDACRDPERFVGWLMQIVRNRARNVLLARSRRESDGDAESVVAPRPESAGLRDRLLRALDGLSEAQREVVLLHDLEGWTHAEIAAALELTETNSRQHLFVARRALRERLAEDAPEMRSERHG
jgi:RNA polymerase sigma-70 factor (ECF subfamily)